MVTQHSDSGSEPTDPRGDGAGWLSPVAALTRFDGARALESLPREARDAEAVQQRWAIPVGGYWLLVDPALGCELSEWTSPCRLPNAPRWLRGVTNMRGSLVPVFDLRPFLGDSLDETRDQQARIFVLGDGDRAGAVVIQGLPYRQALDGGLTAEAAPSLQQPMAARVKAAYRQNGQWLLDCDLAGLLRELGAQAAAA
jgi:twitching motility protein PilI